MTDKLPPNLLALFAPRPPLRWIAPVDHASGERKTPQVTSVAAYLPQLEDYKQNDDYEPTESWLQRKDRQKAERQARQKMFEGEIAEYQPTEDPNIRGDAFKTLIVARLSYDATEQDVEREFGRFGPIERTRIVVDTHQSENTKKKKKNHRGYAFVVFEREKDMRAALEGCDGIRIKDRRVKVDVERGRTVRGWKPRRFGGGLGGRGYTKALAPRPMGPGGFNGPPGGPSGFRGGFRGGFSDRGGRGGFGGRGGGGFQDRGGFGGGRGGIGYQGPGRDGGFQPRGRDSGGYSAPPNAPAGPGGRAPSSGGYGGMPDRSGGRSYDDRSGGGYRGESRGYGNSGSGSNMEPVRPREGGYRDRDAGDRGYSSRDGPPRDGGYGRRDDDSRKRAFDDGASQYREDPRKLRKY